MTDTMDELSRYLTDGAGGSLRWEFPNGHHVSVISDPHTILRFEVLSSDPADRPVGHIRAGLTTEQVEAKLAEVYALPPATREPTVALVTVDDQGRLTDESTLTVGEWTWPVPARTGRVGADDVTGRIAGWLKARGWKVAGEPKTVRKLATGQHIMKVPVEPIETNEED